MKRKRPWKVFLAVMASAFLMAATMIGAESRPATRESVARVSPAPNARTQTRRVETFRTERTDTWLCLNVSPFFCNIFPTLESRPDAPGTPKIYRGRN